MEIIGKIYKVGENLGGKTTDGREWVSKTIVIETMDSTPRKLAFNANGVERVNDIEEMKLNADELVKVVFSASSREHNGRWYSELKLISIEKMTKQ